MPRATPIPCLPCCSWSPPRPPPRPPTATRVPPPRSPCRPVSLTRPERPALLQTTRAASTSLIWRRVSCSGARRTPTGRWPSSATGCWRRSRGV